jgi:phosphatidylinositol alpha-1,6-mannosyltransferase
VLRGAEHIIAAGGYPAREGDHAAGRPLASTIVPPGVDTSRFVPLSREQRDAARRQFGLGVEDEIVLGVSRLVPRKGFDILIRAAARLAERRPRLRVVIASTGRDEQRLRDLAKELDAPVTFLGRVAHDDLPKLYGCADVFSMMCRNRWGGLEQEGFGIVFVEAAACGVPQVAGDSGGAAEAVLDGVTGYVLSDPNDVDGLTEKLTTILDDEGLRASMADASRKRAVTEFDYDALAARLARVLKVTQ